jgi:hypothetical protein
MLYRPFLVGEDGVNERTLNRTLSGEFLAEVQSGDKAKPESKKIKSSIPV